MCDRKEIQTIISCQKKSNKRVDVVTNDNSCNNDNNCKNNYNNNINNIATNNAF